MRYRLVEIKDEVAIDTDFYDSEILSLSILISFIIAKDLIPENNIPLMGSLFVKFLNLTEPILEEKIKSFSQEERFQFTGQKVTSNS